MVMPFLDSPRPGVAHGRLAGRRVLITGASSGVGLAAARLFLDAGASCALLSRRAEAIADGLGPRPSEALLLSADVADRDAVSAAVAATVEHLGGLDLVVLNAGVASFGHLLEVHPDDYERTVAVTFLGAVNTVRAALPHLRDTRGMILATGSLNTRVPLPGWNAYAASKHALRGFLNTVRCEEREQGTGVRVSMLHPGPIDTPLWAGASSATGRQPQVPPDAYRPEVIAAGLVALASASRPRAEVVLGGLTVGIDILFARARPVGELVMSAVDRWYRSGTEPARPPGSLWQAPIGGQTSGGVPARDSLLAPLQLGRRLAPDPRTPLRLASHGVTFARLALANRERLLAPVPERPAPERSLREAGEGEPVSADRGKAHVGA